MVYGQAGQCFPIPFSCLPVSCQTPTVPKWRYRGRPAICVRRVWRGRGIWSKCQEVMRRPASRLSMQHIRNGCLRIYLSGFWLSLLVINDLYEKHTKLLLWSQVLQLETSLSLDSPCTLHPPCLLDCQLGGRKLQGRSIRCPEASRAPP